MKSSHIAIALLATMSCAPQPVPAPVTPLSRVTPAARPSAVDTLIRSSFAEAGLQPDLGTKLDSIVKVALSEHAAPGATLAVGRHGRLVYLKGYGRLDTAVASAPVDANTMYDLSLIHI